MPDRVVLDTTVLIDWFKNPTRRSSLAPVLEGRGVKLTTSFAFLEFKAVMIRECITIHNDLVRSKSYIETRDTSIEKLHRQSRLRAHIFTCHINVLSPSHRGFEIDPVQDAEFAKEAALALEMLIPELYDDCKDLVIDLLDQKIRCDRARERPEKTGKTFPVLIPHCVRGKNKTCCVEQTVREVIGPKAEAMRLPAVNSPQLTKALARIDEVIADQGYELTADKCRSMGDLLIAAESEGVVSHLLSSNRRDWEIICQHFGLTFEPVEF